jgi:hypothetical protein
MSYSLFLHFKPQLRQADMMKYFAARKHYKATKDRVSYTNEDTGVYFWLKPRLSRDLLLRRTVVSAEFEINYNRPSFFGPEAEKELSAFIAAFQPKIEDPQMEGMGEGPYSSDGFLRGWNFSNRFAAQQTGAKDSKVTTMPAAALRAAWQWNYGHAERRDGRNLRNYVLPILFWRIDGRARRVIVWRDSSAILMPRVDYVVVAKEVGGTPQAGIVSWAEFVELAHRAGFDTSKEPIELRYLTPPQLVTDWAATIPLIDLKAIERLHAYQILDEELVAAARDSATQDGP